MQHSLKLGGTNYHSKWVKLLGITPYWKAWQTKFITLDTHTFICTIVEHIKSVCCLFSFLFITKDQINPLMDILRNIFRFLISKIKNFRTLLWNHLFVGYQFSWFSWVGWSTKIRIQQTMKHGKQLDINILANAVLDFLDQLHRVQLTISMTK